MASYPSAVKVFSTKNAGDAIQATHVNDLQDEVAALETALLGSIAHAVTIANTFSVTALGDHAFSAGAVGANILRVRNTSAGVANYAALLAGNDADQSAAGLYALSSSFTTSGANVQDSAVLQGVRPGGVSIVAAHASGDIRFYSGGATSGALRTQLTDAGLLEHNNAFALSGVVSPAQITSNQNNYAPASFAAAALLRLNSDAARDITGIAGGAAGRLIALSNQGSFTITLKHNSGSSTAGNRLLCPGAGDFALTTFKTCWIQYDATATAWVVIG